MEIFNESPLQATVLPAPMQPGRPTMTVLVKATFDLVHGELSRLAEEQVQVAPETPNEGPQDEPSLRYDSDLAFFKSRAECFVAGTAHAPEGKSVRALTVGFRVGSVAKVMAVIGDREWKKALLGRQMTEPEPFTSMPLSLERAFGGPGFSPNPLGSGIAQIDGRWPLPNLEDPKALIDSPRSRPEPVGFFPVPCTFERRVKLAGTFDARWKKERWPYLPENFDPRYFNAAPADQQIQGYFRGDEEIVLDNLRPDVPRLISRLPGLVPLCLIETRGSTEGPREVSLALDTITVDAELMRVFCLWRALVGIPEQNLNSVDYIAVELQKPGMEGQLAELAGRVRAQREARRTEDEVAEELPPPAPGEELTPPPAPEASARAREDLLERLKAGASVNGVDFTGADLKGLVLEGADLRGAILTGADLSGAKLTGAKLDEAQLSGAKLAGADFSRASLAGADLTGAQGARACFEGAKLDGACLDGGVFPGIVLTGASMKTAELVGADLSGAQAQGADLFEADLTGARLGGSDLSGAILTDACIEEASLEQAVLVGAVLEKVRGSKAKLNGAKLNGAKAKKAKLGEAHLGSAVLEGVSLSEADLSGAMAQEAVFSGSDLRGARLDGANLSRAVFRSCDLFGASLEQATLSETDLSGANCFAAGFFKAKLDKVRLDGTNLARTTLENS